MAFDKDPNEVQKLQINETVRFIQNFEKLLKNYDKYLDFLYYTMANYNPPDEDLKPLYDRYLMINAMLKSLVADTKIYNGKNYTSYSGLEPPVEEDESEEESF